MNKRLRRICTEYTTYKFDVIFEDDLTQERYIPDFIQYYVLNDRREVLTTGVAVPTSSMYTIETDQSANIMTDTENNREGRHVLIVIYKENYLTSFVFYTHLYSYWLHKAQLIGGI